MDGARDFIAFLICLLKCLCPGKYVGNRPIKLKKADTNIRPVEIGHKKAKQLEKDLKKNRHKPY